MYSDHDSNPNLAQVGSERSSRLGLSQRPLSAGGGVITSSHTVQAAVLCHVEQQNI